MPSACKKPLLFRNTLVACIRLCERAAIITATLDRDSEQLLCAVRLAKSEYSIDWRESLCKIWFLHSRRAPLFSFSAQTMSQEGMAKSSVTLFRNCAGKVLPPTLGGFFYRQESIRDAQVTLLAADFLLKKSSLKSLLCAPGSKYTHTPRECCRIERSAVGSERKGKKVSLRSTAAN